jgi:serine/threonine protein kinase
MTTYIGQLLNRRYRLDALLGDGGMGTVYRGYDLNLERMLAVKLMHSHFARQEEFRQRLVQEARTAAQLDHPSIVRVYDFGDSELGLFIAMEYVDGGSLRDHLRRLQRMQKFLPLNQSLQIAIQIAEALDYAHRRKIIHRDVKPGNIILKRLTRPDEAGAQPFRALLTDFGLVKLQESDAITQSGTTVGTPTYMSPEQCEGRQLDGRSDLYSLGVVLYELVTNKMPFSFNTLTEAIATHQAGTMPQTASEIRPEVPPIIDTLLEKSLAKSPENRFTSGAEMADALRSAAIALEGAPTRVMIHQELDILDAVPEPPPGYELHIHTPGHPKSVVPLTRSVVTLGRNPDNDIVLPADGVSRNHTRLQATALGWEVVDLGGVNGTWVNDRRLRPDESTPLPVNSVMRIGPYEMTLEGPELPVAVMEEPADVVSGPVTPGVALAAAAPVGAVAVVAEAATSAQPEDPPLAIYLARDTLYAEPGQRLELKVDIENRTDQDDRVYLRVQGLDPSWLVLPDEFKRAPAKETIPFSFAIRVPKDQNIPSGKQRLRLQVVSQRHPDSEASKSASLTIGGFEAFEAGIDTEEVRLPGHLTVTIHNSGNVPSQYSVVARDISQALRFQGERGRITLEPGQTALVEMAVEARQTSWFGREQLYPFEIEVASVKGARHVMTGDGINRPFVPPFWLYALLFLGTVALLLGMLSLWTNRSRLFGIGATATPTATLSFPEIAATQTGVAVAQTAAVGTQVAQATNSAATAVAQGDSDRDGLSNEQEAVIGTDPNNPDTDADGLGDGDEVLVHSTDPRNRDTDNDILLDGDEVNRFRTNPRVADTDGDGIPDGLEIAQGSDPLDPNSPGATPTPTLTLTPPPQATLTWTPLPTVTPTIQPLPTLTPTLPPLATATSTLPPPATATATVAPPTAAASPTVTLTSAPPPAYVLSCVPTPPIIDGTFDLGTEWNGTPLFQFQPAGNPARLVQVYFTRDAGRLYMAFLINDTSSEPTDSLRVYFDTTANGGDPDTADRFIQITRDGASSMWAGIGTNSDGAEWNSNYTSTNWSAAVGEAGGGQWVVELEINAAAEMAALSDPFGLMTQVLYTGDLAVWPEGALSNLADTFEPIGNAFCR